MAELSRSERGACPGDRVIVHPHHQGEHERDGEILEVHGKDGAPPFLVRWEDGITSMLYPGSDVMVKHYSHDREHQSSS